MVIDIDIDIDPRLGGICFDKIIRGRGIKREF
jgi:hypothetical protein